ncbi:MAG TPA: autoinducer 2 ABC transporter substrate-binding protein, partial [Thermotoga sp.]|nr:autoinducer 2 ABC transporter substrate-binding protein [Thermotoga sp.]
MRKFILSVLIISILLVSMITLGAKKYEIAVVVKIAGIPWFNRMAEGVAQAAKELGVNAYLIGPATADPAPQVQMVGDLVTRGVDAICVVPNDA